MLIALDRLIPFLADLGLAASTLFFLIVLAMVLCRQPTRRRVWARSGLISSLLLPALISLNPGPRLDVSAALRPLIRPSTVRSALDSLPVPEMGPARRVWMGRAIGVGYLLGSAAFLGWWLMGRWGVRFVVGHSVPPSDEAEAAFDAIPYRGLLPRPRLRVSARVGRPVLAGFWRTTILIPPTLDLPEEEPNLIVSLEHELAHAASADPFFLWINGLAQALWFGIPPFWWIREQVRLDQEFLADREAAGARGAASYASSLLDLARAGGIGAEPEGESGPRGRHAAESVRADATSPLFLRILMLIRNPFPIEVEAPRGLTWAAGGATLAMATALSCLTLGFWDDAESWPGTAPGATTPFLMKSLDLPPAGEAAEPFQVRYRLGDAFTLDAEVFSTAGELQDLRILEHSLGSLQGLTEVLFDEAAWHRVRIMRSHGHESVWVDDAKVADRVPIRDRSSWISVRPLPDRPTSYRNIAVRPLQSGVDAHDLAQPSPAALGVPN